MCFCSPIKRDMPAFKSALYNCHQDKAVVHSTLGKMVIRDADNFTTVTQPMIVDGRLVYGIKRYGSDEIVFVHDDDNITLPENEMGTKDFEILPIGMRKAAALETSIHLENVRKYGLEDVDSSSTRYFPKNPRTIYDRSCRKAELAQTRPGRLWLSFLEFFGW